MQMMAPLLAGLGLFLCGVHFVSINLTPLAGRRFRAVLTRLIKRPWLAAFTGTLAGVMTQSTSAVTYVIIGLVSGGVVDKRRAILIPTWAHVGTSALVILVAVNFKAVASYLVALAGFAIYFGFERTDRARHIIGTLLGIGLLFLGLDAVKNAAGPLRDLLMGDGIVAAVAGHPALLLLLGAVLTVICQSSTVVGAIAVAATSVGIFDLPAACWLVYGSNLGSGLNHIVLARTLRGDAAQIALIQAVQKFSGFLGIMAILGIEVAIGHDFLYSDTTFFALSESGRVAIVFLIYQLIGSLFCSIFLDQIIAILEALSPPSPLQELSKPMYLIDEALVEPTFAIELVGREERRLIERLPAMLDEVRADAEGPSPSSKVLRAAGAAITHAMSQYMEDILSAHLDRDDREGMVRMQHRVANLNSLFESLDELVAASRNARKSPASGMVADQMIESLHSLLMALVDATMSSEPEDLQFLLSLLGHRDEIMDKIRRRVMREDPNLPLEAQSALFSATMLFERVIWLARRNALLLASEAETPAAAQAEAA